MRRVFLISVLSLGFLLAPIGQAQAVCPKCTNAGLACEGNRQMFFAGLTALSLVYHNFVLNPMVARYPQSKALVYTVGYGVPAAAAFGAYKWWNSGSKQGERAAQ